jgi:anti-anti-sigma factor
MRFANDIQRLMDRLKEMAPVLCPEQPAPARPTAAGSEASPGRAKGASAPPGPYAEARQVGGVTVIELRTHLLAGEQEAKAVSEAVKALLPAAAPRVVLSFARVEWIDSTGLATLVGISRRVRLAGGDLRVCRLQPTIEQQFRLIRLDTLFGVCATEEEAVAALQPATKEGAGA